MSYRLLLGFWLVYLLYCVTSCSSSGAVDNERVSEIPHKNEAFGSQTIIEKHPSISPVYPQDWAWPQWGGNGQHTNLASDQPQARIPMVPFMNWTIEIPADASIGEVRDILDSTRKCNKWFDAI